MLCWRWETECWSAWPWRWTCRSAGLRTNLTAASPRCARCTTGKGGGEGGAAGSGLSCRALHAVPAQHRDTATLSGTHRTLRPPPVATLGCSASDAPGGIGAGAHTDFGAITLLLTDEHSGLQLRLRDKWVDVPPRPDCFVMNIGDLMELWTNGAEGAPAGAGVILWGAPTPTWQAWMPSVRRRRRRRPRRERRPVQVDAAPRAQHGARPLLNRLLPG